jgi:hypothetical protein
MNYRVTQLSSGINPGYDKTIRHKDFRTVLSYPVIWCFLVNVVI